MTEKMKMTNFAAIAALLLVGGWLAGCEQQDQLLSTIPNSITNPHTPVAATGGVGGPGTVPIPTTAPATPATFTMSSGRQVLVACPPTQPDLDCADFPCEQDSQTYLGMLAAAGLGDCHQLDANGDGKCNTGDTTCP